MWVLESISDEQKQKAFEKAKEEASFKVGTLVRVTEKYHRAALDFARDHFVPDEPVVGNAGVVWGPDVEAGWVAVFRMGFSIMLIDENNDDKVIAFRITRIHKDIEDPYGIKNVKDEGTKRIWAYAEYLDERAKIFEHFGIKEALHLAGLAVHRDYRRQGLAKQIMKTALNMYQYLGVDPIYVKGEASSNFSKRVFADTGFIKFYDVPYDEYMVDGEQVFKNTGIHKSQATYALVLKAKKL